MAGFAAVQLASQLGMNVYLVRHPEDPAPALYHQSAVILLGSGVPFFRDAGRRTSLELAEARVIDGGCVLMTYRVGKAKQGVGGARKARARERGTGNRALSS